MFDDALVFDGPVCQRCGTLLPRDPEWREGSRTLGCRACNAFMPVPDPQQQLDTGARRASA